MFNAIGEKGQAIAIVASSLCEKCSKTQEGIRPSTWTSIEGIFAPASYSVKAIWWQNRWAGKNASLVTVASEIIFHDLAEFPSRHRKFNQTHYQNTAWYPSSLPGGSRINIIFEKPLYYAADWKTFFALRIIERHDIFFYQRSLHFTHNRKPKNEEPVTVTYHK